MRGLGIMLWGGGLLIGAYGLLVFQPHHNGYVSFDLQHRQLLIVAVAGLMLLLGVLLHAFSYMRPPVAISEDTEELPLPVDRRPGIHHVNISDEEIAAQERDSAAFNRQAVTGRRS